MTTTSSFMSIPATPAFLAASLLRTSLVPMGTSCVPWGFPVTVLAWISTGPDLPNMVLGQTAHFRALSLRNYYAKWCADSPIAQRLLAQRSRDSGQFRSLLDE